MNLIQEIENNQLKSDIPDIKAGDTVKVNVKVSEGNRERIQTYEGVVISLKGVTVNKTITVRKLSFGVGVERIFPIHAPIIDSIEVTRKGKVRRSKLYYLRQRSGKSARIAEKKDVVKKKSATRSSDHNNQIKLAKVNGNWEDVAYAPA